MEMSRKVEDNPMSEIQPLKVLNALIVQNLNLDYNAF